MFENNNFARDTHEQHNQRVLLCAPSATTYAVALGLRADWVAGINAHATAFSGLLDDWNIEDAEYHGAVEDLHAKREALLKLNFDTRWMVKTVLDDPALAPGVVKMINDAFDIDEPLSNGVDMDTEG